MTELSREPVVQPDFAAVASAFEATADPDGGSQLCVIVDGEVVVDLAHGIPTDAVMTVYSCTKGAAAIVTAVLVDRGLLDLDATVTYYWPEFAQEGKAAVTVRQLLSHQAGLPEIDGGIPDAAWRDEQHVAGLLAAQRPLWWPGSAFGYHALTIGTLAGELCRRVTGESLQAFYEREVRVPRRIDLYLGLPESERARVVALLPMREPTPEPRARPEQPASPGPGPFNRLVFGSSVGEGGAPITSDEGQALGLPSAGGVGSARGIAALYAAVLGEGPVVAPATVEAFAQTQVIGYDVVLDRHRSHGIVFQKPTPDMPFGSHRAFGHDGAGGGLGYADPVGGIAFGYLVQRTPFPGGADARAIRLGAMVRDILRV